MPFLCDLIGFSVLVLAAWWLRKLGAITAIGLIATAINFTLVPGGFQFIGFTGASIFFDLTTAGLSHITPFRKAGYFFASMVPISIASAAVAGYIIGVFFMAGQALVKWGEALGWAGLHAIGGIIGGVIGVFLIAALNSRKIIVNHNPARAEKQKKQGSI
jgi:MFS family permease